MQIATVCINLAKNVFQIHGVNEHGKPVLRKQMRREQLSARVQKYPSMRVEFCLGALAARHGDDGYEV